MLANFSQHLNSATESIKLFFQKQFVSNQGKRDTYIKDLHDSVLKK